MESQPDNRSFSMSSFPVIFRASIKRSLDLKRIRNKLLLVGRSGTIVFGKPQGEV